MNKPRVLLVGRYYIIEPLGIIYLRGLAESLGFEARAYLVKGADFERLLEEIASFQPDFVGFSIWTGYHLTAFDACDAVRNIGLPVIIGGPHATYTTEECAKHADYVVKGEGYRNFRKILQGELAPGVYFDSERVAEGFPTPKRDAFYASYPELGKSAIKSIMCSVGCPFTCSYCYAPAYNAMYEGFELKVRPVDQIIDEAHELKDRWPTKMIYFQDDIFGFDMRWLAEFTKKWKREIDLPWHCQIRLELTRNIRRLDLFKEGGCTGITLAIESGDNFLREFVLRRAMSEDLIIEGIQKIKDRGFTLRTEQILAVPFSDIDSDLRTLELNCKLNPEMAWTSILAPYLGTEMGRIAAKFGFYAGNNDDLQETFFDRSVLRHCKGREKIAEILYGMRTKVGGNPLIDLQVKNTDGPSASIFLISADGTLSPDPVCEIEYLSKEENERYNDQTVMLHNVFFWLAKVPQGFVLGKKITDAARADWTWKNIGAWAKEHLTRVIGQEKLAELSLEFARKMGHRNLAELPEVLQSNPYYFIYIPKGEDLATHVVEQGLFDTVDDKNSFVPLDTLTRRHLFMVSLYKIDNRDNKVTDGMRFIE